MKEIPKNYNPQEVEDSIYKAWEESGFFNPDNLPGERPDYFSISLPPPNATGTLHTGHALMLAYQDIMIRYNRLQGKKAVWVPGTDHAAIATQAKVEKIIYEKEKKTRHDFEKEEFLDKVRDFAENSKTTIRKQLRKMGASLDWSRERYTLDEGLSQVVKYCFVKMHDAGILTRKHRIVNWCPHCHSTLSDDEVEYEPKKEKLYWLKYGPFVLATSRPETKLGDTAVAVHPKDERYKDMVGKKYMIPGVLGEFEVEVVADDAVDPEFGSGVIKVTPAHDFTDFEIAQRHNLKIKQIINEDGKMMDNTGKYAGLITSKAREEIVKDMEKLGLIDHIDEDYDHNQAVCYRCGTQIEPIPSLQWFVEVNKKITLENNKYFQNKSIKEVALEVVRNKEINIIPDRFEKDYYHWLENLRDWCISRQIWFGHDLPVWYREPKDPKNWEMKLYGQETFDNIKNNLKTIETRAGREKGDGKDWSEFKPGDVIDFSLVSQGDEKVMESGLRKKVVRTVHFNSVDQMLESFDLGKISPNNTPEDFKKWWQSMPELDKRIQDYGIWAIELTDIDKPVQEVYVGLTPPEEEGWQKDQDTLDTWFSSGLWTFSTLMDKDFQKYNSWEEWVKGSKDLQQFHPTTVMETGYDILFFWVARMIIQTTFMLGDIPFKNVYLHGLIRDEQGRKMSKSLGNTMDPLDLIASYGTDALRIAMIHGTSPGADSRLYDEKVAGSRNFVNKLWNISRYIFTSVKEIKRIDKEPAPKTLADKDILTKLNLNIFKVSDYLDRFEFSSASEFLKIFTLDYFADWYLEISKIEGDKDEILLYILERLLILWHPYIPFVTEEIWKNFESDQFLMIEQWPNDMGKDISSDNEVLRDFKLVRDIITSIRNLRGEFKIEPAKLLKAKIFSKNDKLIKSQEEIIKKLARLESVEITQTGEKGEKVISSFLPDVEIHLSVEGIVDLDKEKERIQEEIAQTDKFIKQLEGKLGNKEFVSNAPKEIVEKEQQKLRDQKEKKEKLEEKLKNI